MIAYIWKVREDFFHRLPLYKILFQTFGFFLRKLMHLNDKKNRVKAKRKYDFRCQTFKEYFVESFTFSANTCIKFV